MQLLDTGLETRNMSLILRNVSSSDNGTYECRVAPGGSRHKRAIIDTEPISVIRLKIAGECVEFTVLIPDKHEGYRRTNRVVPLVTRAF